MTIADVRPLSASQRRATAIRAVSPRLIGFGAALAMGAGVGASELTFTTEDSLKITGFNRETGECEEAWQSAEFLLSSVGMPMRDATATTVQRDQALQLEQGWTYVQIECVEPPEEAPVDDGGVGVVPYWVYLRVRDIGAGAEGTSFIAELEGKKIHFYSDSENSPGSFVLLSIPCPDSANAKTVKLSPGQYALVESDDANPPNYSVNGVPCADLVHDSTLANLAVPPAKAAFHRQAKEEGDRHGF